MAFTPTYIPYQRQQRFFQFFATGATHLNESLDLSKPFEICDIRLHLSVAHPSIEYLKARLSAIAGSAYNVMLVSTLASGTTDIFWQPSTPLVFGLSDQILFSMMNSTGVVWGLCVTGWHILP